MRSKKKWHHVFGSEDQEDKLLYKEERVGYCLRACLLCMDTTEQGRPGVTSKQIMFWGATYDGQKADKQLVQIQLAVWRLYGCMDTEQGLRRNREGENE